jgi:hypothetical protein
LTQKWEANKHVLEHIMNLFFPSAGRPFGSKDGFLTKGCVVPHSAPGVWELRVNGVKNCLGLFPYFDEYSLITKKKGSYLKWKIIHSRLVKGDHLNDTTRSELVNLAKQINKAI